MSASLSREVIPFPNSCHSLSRLLFLPFGVAVVVSSLSFVICPLFSVLCSRSLWRGLDFLSVVVPGRAEARGGGSTRREMAETIPAFEELRGPSGALLIARRMLVIVIALAVGG